MVDDKQLDAFHRWANRVGAGVRKAKEKTPEEAGFDAGYNGPNESNCHFSYFDTDQRKREWEQGNRRGKKLRAQEKG